MPIYFAVAVSRFSREELSFPCASLLLFAAHSSQSTNMTLTSLISTLVQGVGDILLHNGVSQEIIERSREQLETLAEGFVSQLSRLEKEISDQREANQQLQVRVSELEKRVKQCVLSDKRRDVAATRNAVIVRSDPQKSEKEVRKFISCCLELGGGPTVAEKNINLAELRPPKDQVRSKKVYHVILLEGQKANLFTGLQTASLDSDTAFSIDNDCPLFAAPYKKMLDQLSFSLRKKHGASDKLRTKIILSNLKLKIKLRDSSAKHKRDWFSPEDDRAAKYFDNTRVLYKADNTPATIPTCREFYKQILDLQAE